MRVGKAVSGQNLPAERRPNPLGHLGSQAPPGKDCPGCPQGTPRTPVEANTVRLIPCGQYRETNRRDSERKRRDHESARVAEWPLATRRLIGLSILRGAAANDLWQHFFCTARKERCCT